MDVVGSPGTTPVPHISREEREEDGEEEEREEDGEEEEREEGEEREEDEEDEDGLLTSEDLEELENILQISKKFIAVS